ncbi:MAG: helix-turn-helix domain-containing protein [Reichenbachiella sp.]|uniref:GlxA family transcriptional regulator n=1 Tax=Reichenbachiella sp. TaxID=2184521 RepID=UPI0032672322
MKHISVIVPEGPVVLSSIVGTFKLFGQVNNFLAAQGLPPCYKIQLVGLNHETRLYEGLFTINPHVTIDQVKKTDLVVVTTIMGDMQESLALNKDFVPWINDMYRGGAEVASLCMGAFLLADTGLLDGKRATTHWIGTQQFQDMFPNVLFQQDKIITDEKGTYTSGGAFSFLNLLIYLIEKYNGRDMAILSSKLFEIDIDRYNQSEFVIFEAQKGHGDDTIQKAQDYIESNFSNSITIDQMADVVSLSRRNFIRRFKAATQNTPYEYVQRVRVEAAKKSLERTTQNVSEVMMEVGYSDSKAFRGVFRKLTGCSPVEYKMKYNKYSSKVSGSIEVITN